jgi:tetratricopeptide (TPR) repeat protein
LILGQAYLLKSFADEPDSFGGMVADLTIAHAFAVRAGDDLLLVETWDELGGAMINTRTPYSEILEFVRQEREWASMRGIPFAEADAMLGEAYALVAVGESDAARAQLAKVKALFASLPGAVSQHGESFNLAAQLEYNSGDLDAAESEYRQAMQLFDTPTTVRWWHAAATGLANTLLDQSRLDEAAQLLAEMRSRGRTSLVHHNATEELANARLMAAQGNTARAIEMADQAIASIVGSDSIGQEARLREHLAGILLAAGDGGRARTELGRSAELFAEKGYLAAERRVRTKLAALG